MICLVDVLRAARWTRFPNGILVVGVLKVGRDLGIAREAVVRNILTGSARQEVDKAAEIWRSKVCRLLRRNHNTIERSGELVCEDKT